jgi:HEAT repeats
VPCLWGADRDRSANPAAVPSAAPAAPTAPAFARTGPGPAAAPTAGPPAAPAAVAAAVIRFEAIGEAWRLFRQETGVWILAALIVTFGCAAVQFALFLLSIPMSIVGSAFLSGGLSFFTALGSFAVSMGVWGIFLGGMYRVALKQIDGHSTGLNDLVSGTDILPSLALASLLAGLAAFGGFLCLVIPGWMISGILMFTLPLVVDARLKAVDALSVSWKTLKDQWLLAAVFALVLWVMQIVGMMFCGLGYLVTLPLSVLSQAILYRGFFPRGGAPAKPAQDVDPDFGPIPVAVATRPKGRIPAWAWLAAAAGLLAPTVVLGLGIALMIGLFSTVYRGIHQNDKTFQQEFRKFENRRQEAAQAPGQPALPGEGNVFGPNLGGLGGREINDVKGVLAEHDNRRDAPDASPPVERRPGADLGAGMQELLERRRRQVRQKPADPRKGVGGQDLIDLTPLVANLNDKDEGVRRAALDRLARSTPNPAQHDEVIKALEPLLGDALPTLRAAAAKALAVWANEDDVPALIRAVDDKDPGVRRQAVVAFGRIDDERAVGPVARHLADPDVAVHNDAVRTLKQIGSIAEGEVVKYLGAVDVRVRERACQVLQTIGTKDSIPALTRAASVRSPVSRTAQAALKAIAARNRRK